MLKPFPCHDNDNNKFTINLTDRDQETKSILNNFLFHIKLIIQWDTRQYQVSFGTLNPHTDAQIVSTKYTFSRAHTGATLPGGTNKYMAKQENKCVKTGYR